MLSAPTVSADGELPGDEMPPTTGVPSASLPTLPAATVTRMPASVARCTAWHSGSSRSDSITGCPSETLTIRMFHARRLSMAQSIASMTSLVCPEPSAPIAFRLTMCAPGATSRMMPAMCVPWPFSSPSRDADAAPVKSRLSADAAAQVRMPRVDAGVDHRHADAAAGEAAQPLDRALPHLVGADRLGRHRRHRPDRQVARHAGDVGVLAQIAQLPAGHLEDGGIPQALLDARAVARRQDLDLLVARRSR